MIVTACAASLKRQKIERDTECGIMVIVPGGKTLQKMLRIGWAGASKNCRR